jgi:hypothetical protein
MLRAPHQVSLGQRSRLARFKLARGAAMAMREEMVENGLKFLQHPNVQVRI